MSVPAVQRYKQKATPSTAATVKGVRMNNQTKDEMIWTMHILLYHFIT